MVSIIIVNWNGLEHIQECLQSVYEQTYKEFEIIMVDNNSTDGSIEWVHNNYPQVHVVELDYNSGFATGNNIGYQYTKGDYIVLLNNDTRVDVHWLEELVAAANENDVAGFVSPKIKLYDNNDRLDNTGVYYTTAGCTIERGRFMLDTARDEKQDILSACACATLYKRSMLEDIGFFEDLFFYGYEDVDLSLRAAWAGYRGFYCANAVVYHKVQATRKKYSKDNIYYSQRNNSLVWIRNTTLWQKCKYLFPRFFYNVGSLIYFSSKGYVMVFIKARWDALVMSNHLKIGVKRRIAPSEFEKMLTKGFATSKLLKFLKMEGTS